MSDRVDQARGQAVDAAMPGSLSDDWTNPLAIRYDEFIDCETLDADAVHVWYADLQHERAAISALQLTLLSAEERQQHDRFVFARDRHRYLVTRALVRSVLARYCPIGPQSWTFEKCPHGRPRIGNPEPGARRIRFNVSHTHGLAILGLTADREIGIDTESSARSAPLDVARHFFSADETAALLELPPPQRSDRFWELWTFKECYVKARALGLSLPLDGFSFHLDTPARVSVRFERSLGDAADRWRFVQFRSGAEHLVAVCIERKGDEAVRFIHRAIRPLEDWRQIETAPTRDSLDIR